MFIYDSCNNDETVWKSRNYVTSKCSHCWYVQGVKNKKKNILHYRQRRKEWLSFEICNVHGQTKTKDAAGQQRYNQRQIDRLAISEQINQSKERKNT